jgi:hypothetical protein
MAKETCPNSKDTNLSINKLPANEPVVILKIKNLEIKPLNGGIPKHVKIAKIKIKAYNLSILYKPDQEANKFQSVFKKSNNKFFDFNFNS